MSQRKWRDTGSYKILKEIHDQDTPRISRAIRLCVEKEKKCNREESLVDGIISNMELCTYIHTYINKQWRLKLVTASRQEEKNERGRCCNLIHITWVDGWGLAGSYIY